MITFFYCTAKREKIVKKKINKWGLVYTGQRNWRNEDSALKSQQQEGIGLGWTGRIKRKEIGSPSPIVQAQLSKPKVWPKPNLLQAPRTSSKIRRVRLDPSPELNEHFSQTLFNLMLCDLFDLFDLLCVWIFV